mgnify:CR=1 FL=1
MNMNKVIEQLPEMLSGQELLNEMSIIPKYDKSIQENGSTAERLLKLSDLYSIYIPSQMSAEIYSKLYLGIIRSLQKKGNKLAVQQFNSTYKVMQNIRKKNSDNQYEGIIGGADSFTIIGASGIGKSSAISRALNLIEANHVIESNKPYVKILPCLTVQCPFDSSVKGLLIEILRKVDEQLGTSYCQIKRSTTDMLIGTVSQVCLNHIGLLVVDEIQNVVNSKNGKNLIGSLTQLINNSGISICMVGTPESEMFFEQAMQLARRSVGLKYSALPYDEHFYKICEVLFSYQYVQNISTLNDAVVEWLYQHSSGVISIVVSLIHDAQEISILNGREVLDINSLEEAYQNRLSMLHEYIKPVRKKSVSKIKKRVAQKNIDKLSREKRDNEDMQCLIQNIVKTAKDNNCDVIELLSQYISVEVI